MPKAEPPKHLLTRRFGLDRAADSAQRTGVLLARAIGYVDEPGLLQKERRRGVQALSPLHSRQGTRGNTAWQCSPGQGLICEIGTLIKVKFVRIAGLLQMVSEGSFGQVDGPAAALRVSAQVRAAAFTHSKIARQASTPLTNKFSLSP